MSIDSTLSRRMTIQAAVSPKTRFVRAFLPWVIAAAGLLLYLLTLNHWVSFNSLTIVGRLSGWGWQPHLSEPLYWLLTYPLRWLPVKTIPIALNLFSTVCAVLTLALLARSVALLPHDRTHEQRQRELGESSLLSIPAAWLPLVFAVVVCGLQLTFWEHATAASSEMLDLLLFAYVIRSVLEFRIDQREHWLTRSAMVYGLGMANNWAMIGFFPLFLITLIWIRGLAFFNIRFLSRMFICGMLGLLLYLLLPIVQSGAEISSVPFWQGLKANLGNQQGILSALSKKATRPTIALLGLTSILPILVIGIRWASYFGDTSKLGIALATLMAHVVHALFLIACVWVALDPPFSPRHMGYGFSFLTFYYLGALSIGYFSGYFLLVFRPKNERSRRRQRQVSMLNATATSAVCLLAVVTTAALLARNLPQIRTTNGPLFRQTGDLLTQSVPAKNAVVISDDQRRLLLAQAAMAQAGNERDVIFVDSGALKYSQYHQYLKKRLGVRWPGDPPKGKPQLINPLAVVPLLSSLQQSNAIFYLHPSFGYYFEFFYLEPHGLSYKLNGYSNTNLLAPPLTEQLVLENETFWSNADAQVIKRLLPALAQPSEGKKPGFMEQLAKLTHLKAEPNQDALSMAGLYSRGLDYWAVQLQKRKELDKAAAHFERALDLNADNVAAQVNLDCNRKLRAGKPTTVQMSKAISDKFGKYRTWDMVVGENGPFDEPTFCYEQGRVYIQSKLFRQAMEEFARVTELDGTHLPARLWLAQLYIVSRRPEMAIQVVKDIHQKEAEFGVTRTNINELLFAEASAHLAKKDTAGAEAAIEKTLQKYPGSVDLFATATQVYMNFGFYSNALGTIEQQLKLTPDNPAALVNKGFALLQINACEQAIPPLTRALSMQSTNYSALLNRAIAYLRCDKLDDAQHDYQTLQKAFPTAFQIYYGLEEVDYHKKDTNGAIRNCELYLANAPANTDETKFIRARLEELKGPPR